MISQPLIAELQEILHEEFGLELTVSEATATGESLVKVFQTLAEIARTINHPQDESKTLPAA
jgi:hypothetical protein